jgi:division protein CdvB (Snf7/Vps24/ESCRT-III family)
MLQTVRSNEQMMQSMKGATQLLGSMNRQMNLPALQRIAMEFEKENDIMDQRQEMMDDAIDDVTGLEDEEEGEEVVNQVLDEIGVDLSQTVGRFPCVQLTCRLTLAARRNSPRPSEEHCGRGQGGTSGGRWWWRCWGR